MSGIFRLFVGALLLGTLGGCTSLVVAALPIHKGPFEMPDDAKRMCEAEGGLKVYETVENVGSLVSLPTVEIKDGKKHEYGLPCYPCFSPTSFPFSVSVLERYFSEPEQVFYPKPLERHGTGYYRYEAIGRPSELCKPFDDMFSYSSYNGFIERAPETTKAALKNSCIVAIKIREPESAYSTQRIVHEEKRRYRGNSAVLRQVTDEFRRRSDDKLLASWTTFSFKAFGYVNDPSVGCPDGPQQNPMSAVVRSYGEK